MLCPFYREGVSKGQTGFKPRQTGSQVHISRESDTSAKELEALNRGIGVNLQGVLAGCQHVGL